MLKKRAPSDLLLLLMDLRIVRGGVQAVVLLLETVLVRAQLPAAFLAELVPGFMRQRVQWPFKPPGVRSCVVLLPVFFAVRRLPMAWSVWLEKESLLFKGTVRGLRLEKLRTPAWHLVDSLQWTVAPLPPQDDGHRPLQRVNEVPRRSAPLLKPEASDRPLRRGDSFTSHADQARGSLRTAKKTGSKTAQERTP